MFSDFPRFGRFWKDFLTRIHTQSPCFTFTQIQFETLDLREADTLL